MPPSMRLLPCSPQATDLAKKLRIDIDPLNFRACIIMVACSVSPMAAVMGVMTLVVVTLVMSVAMMTIMVAADMAITVAIAMFIVATAAVVDMMAIIMTIIILIMATATAAMPVIIIIIVIVITHHNDSLVRIRAGMTLCVEEFRFLRLNQRRR